MRKLKSGNTDICNQTTGVVLYDGETTVQRDKEVAIGCQGSAATEHHFI
ncbi:hypothetical protein Geob_0074 [Geotalea daltonii FRC-32]|uniref:Uncharacterized protein n=1 Tax=Geotalea daltonii (strain DSM 22248 / JCM 15807 / FRC-32) TaxID=316067 RepID=B9M7Z3_GEODF|nr:hypothetical protein [Geotalea daltonii]ACM18451.1 hypothetical protein Geob_0074 [Geotalea daltonii FRC-32]